MVVSSLASWSSEGQVLGWNNLFRRSKVALAEDIGVLIHEHVVGRRRPAIQVLVVGPVPGGARRVLVERVEQVLGVAHRGGFFDAALGVLAETGSRGVTVGICPCSEAAFAALIDDGLLDL